MHAYRLSVKWVCMILFFVNSVSHPNRGTEFYFFVRPQLWNLTTATSSPKWNALYFPLKLLKDFLLFCFLYFLFLCVNLLPAPIFLFSFIARSTKSTNAQVLHTLSQNIYENLFKKKTKNNSDFLYLFCLSWKLINLQQFFVHFRVFM